MREILSVYRTEYIKLLYDHLSVYFLEEITDPRSVEHQLVNARLHFVAMVSKSAPQMQAKTPCCVWKIIMYTVLKIVSC